MLLKDFINCMDKEQYITIQHAHTYDFITDYALGHQDEYQVVYFCTHMDEIIVLVLEA